MKVSVVIPAHNEEEYIATSLEHLMKQEVAPDEIILINNNSTDQTRQIASKFPIRIVDEPIPGIIAARNRAFDEAQFDIIARTDADSHTPPDWIKKIKENFETDDIDALSGPISYYDIPTKSPVFSRVFYKIAEHVFRHPLLIGPNMAISKFAWAKIKPLLCTDAKAVHEDIDMAIHLHNIGGTIAIDKEIVVMSSGRRIMQQPQSFFLEYTERLFKMEITHAINK